MEDDPKARARGWCFTMFGDLNEIEIKLKALPVQYIVFGREFCPTTGKEHIQGYLYHGEKKTRGALVKKLAGSYRLARGSPQENAKYCKKDGRSIYENGIQPVMGARTDLHVVAEEIRDGASLKDVADNHPGMFVQYARGFAALSSIMMKDRKEKAKVTWVWGSTGTGKTRLAVERCETFYMKDGTQWWDGYTQQKCIIVDDFDGKWPFRDLLRFLDRYPYQGQCKGSYVKINSPEIVITCEHPPSHFWIGTELAQVMRRIDECLHLECPEEKRPEVMGNTMP